MTVYLDTSAAMKLVVDERESVALADFLSGPIRDRLASSYLMYAELHCAAHRRSEVIGVGSVRAVLAAIDLVDVERDDVLVAARLPGRLRSADALHLATAIRIEAESIVVYDAELAAAAQQLGIETLAPG